MESSSYPSRLDQLSPPHSLQEQTWKADMSHPTSPSEVHDTDEDATLLPERLAKLARMASQNAPVSSEDTTAVYHCLDTLEALLDPRPKLTQEIVKCRPPRIYPETSTLVAPSPAYPSPMKDRAASLNEPSHPQLQALLNEVTVLNVELNQRREESFRIYALLMRESQGLSRRISELEDEVHKLESDIVEDSAEREALQGTVRGLEAWINGWQKEPDLAGKAPGTLRQKQAKRWMKHQQEEHKESGTDALLEGITAWMRGWKDVEEGFRVRERDREVKREERRTKVATEPADNT